MTKRFSTFLNYLILDGKLKNQSELCELTGLSKTAVSDLKSGRRLVSLSINRKLCELFPNLNPNYFIDENCADMLRQHAISNSVVQSHAGRDITVSSPETARLIEESRKLIESQSKQITELAAVLRSQMDLISKLMGK